MYKKIYEYIVENNLIESERFYKELKKFNNDFESGFESYKETRERLEKLLKMNKGLEELEDMQEFLWEKIYGKNVI